MIKRISCLFLSAVITLLFIVPNYSIIASAADDKMIIVSLGDSYSSGEGIETFYGQEKKLEEKIKDPDWLAHRSKNSWPGRLKVDGYNGTMKNYHYPDSDTENCKWYFAAVSGAKAEHIWDKEQEKAAIKQKQLFPLDYISHTEYLPPQISIFSKIRDDVDYVTMTIGGNDVEFEKIIIDCVLGCKYLGNGLLKLKIDTLWKKMGSIENDIIAAYEKVREAAGNDAYIIVAGYPELVEYTGKGAAINSNEAKLVNESVLKFNNVLKGLVGAQDNNFVFVDVAPRFKNHQAYSSEPWINDFVFYHLEDLNDVKDLLPSAYSFHPNDAGAREYANLVNEAIRKHEEEKHYGIISGKVCYAYDRTSPVSNAYMLVQNVEGGSAYSQHVNSSGHYENRVKPARYRMEIMAPGCVPFTAYANVVRDRTTYMETFLLVEGQEGDRGIAKGQITNALNGRGVSNAEIKVYDGWNCDEDYLLLKTIKTDSYGNYELDLPIGNYSLVISKNGFITGSKNIIVQRGVTDNQNASITPTVTGNNFRIVLSWGLNPSDLDSHVVGKMSNGNDFHVFYNHKSQYDGSVEICNLDVDDTTSYGPETITLKAESSRPYYYYIHRYAGSGSIATSEARIDVYQGDNLIATYNVPTDQGHGDYWNVFAIDNGQIVERNTMTDQPEITYAENGINSSLRLMSGGSRLIDNFLMDLPKKDGEAKEDAAALVSSKDDKEDASASASSSIEEKDKAAASTSGTSDDKKSDGAAISKSVDDENAGESSSAASSKQTDASKVEASLGEASISDSGAEGSSKNESESDKAGTGNSGSQDEKADNATEGSCVD